MLRVQKVLDVAREAQQLNDDTVYVVLGRTRKGKSTFVLCDMDYLKGKQEAIALYKHEVAGAIRSAGIRGIFDFDEAMEGVNSKEAMGKFNRELEKIFLISAENSMITFLVLPSYRILARTYREDIIDGIFEVYERGKVVFYDRFEVKKINRHMDKYGTFGGGKHSFRDTFPDYRKGNGYLAEGYNKRKKEKVNEALEEFDRQTNPNKKIEKAVLTKSDLIRELKRVNPGITNVDLERATGSAHSLVSSVMLKMKKTPITAYPKTY